jgi:hypothetical protein
MRACFYNSKKNGNQHHFHGNGLSGTGNHRHFLRNRVAGIGNIYDGQGNGLSGTGNHSYFLRNTVAGIVPAGFGNSCAV